MFRSFTKRKLENKENMFSKKDFKKMLKSEGVSLPKEEDIGDDTYKIVQGRDLNLSAKKIGETIFGIIGKVDKNGEEVKTFVKL